MKIMCIWTKREDDNFMKIVLTKKQLADARVDGRKPDKLITKASELDSMKARDLRKYVAHDGVIIIDKTVAYNGMRGLN